MGPHDEAQSAAQAPALSNAEIADRLAGLAQLLSTQKENPYKVTAYHRAAARIRSISESLDELVREDADLTQFAGIGEAIASAIREIVLTGKLRKLNTLRGQATPEVATLADYPRLDPKRVLRIYKKLHISSIEELHDKLQSGEIESTLGLRMAQHVSGRSTSARAYRKRTRCCSTGPTTYGIPLRSFFWRNAPRRRSRSWELTAGVSR
jgi:DNA polymerase (family 10)